MKKLSFFHTPYFFWCIPIYQDSMFNLLLALRFSECFVYDLGNIQA